MRAQLGQKLCVDQPVCWCLNATCPPRIDIDKASRFDVQGRGDCAHCNTTEVEIMSTTFIAVSDAMSPMASSAISFSSPGPRHIDIIPQIANLSRLLELCHFVDAIAIILSPVFHNCDITISKSTCLTLFLPPFKVRL